MQTWQIQEAKSRFSEVVKRAQNQNMSYPAGHQRHFGIGALKPRQNSHDMV